MVCGGEAHARAITLDQAARPCAAAVIGVRTVLPTPRSEVLERSA